MVSARSERVLGMSIAESGFRLLVAKVISTLVLFAGLVYFARQLSPAAMGSFFLFRVLLDGLGLVSDFGIKRAVEKRLSEQETPSGIVTTGFLMKCVLTILVALVLLLLRGVIDGYLGAPITHLLVVSLVVSELGWFYVHVLRGELRVGESAVIEASRLIVWIGVSVPLVEMEYGIQGIVYGFIAGQAVLGVWAFIRVDISPARPSLPRARSLLSFSKYDFVSESGGYVYNWVDVGIIGLLLTQSAVGIYEYAWQITIPIALMYETTMTTLFPEMSRWHADDSTDDIQRVISQAMTIGLFVSVPAFFGALLLSESILGTLFGPAYVAGASVLVVLMAERVIGAFQSVMNITLRGIDEPRQSAFVTTITIFMNLVLNFLLIPEYGIFGAALATLATGVANVTLTYHFLQKHIEVRLPKGDGLKILAVSVLMAAVLLPLKSAVPIDGIVSLGAFVAAGMVVYLAVSSLSPVLRRDLILPGVRVVLTSVAPRRE